MFNKVLSTPKQSPQCNRPLERLAFLADVLKLFVAISLFSFLSIPVAQADTQYVYDETNRLVEVLDASGNAGLYQYDSADNLQTIRRFVSGDLAIAEFTPDSGPEGTAVIIYGIGFSATAASNLVKFNGIAAAVSSATANKLVVSVPVGATTGLISVTVGTKTTTSLDPFTVTLDQVNAAPIIAGFAPTIGIPGTPVAINGNYFEATVGNNNVKFNGTPAVLSSANKTLINTTVPANASSGHVTVRTPYGAAASAVDFYLVPAGYTAAQIGSATRITVDGNANAINTGTAGNIAMVLFDGSQGQNLGLGISPATFTPSGSGTLRILTPQGTDLMPTQSFSAATSVDLPVLPNTGTYTILLIPSVTNSLSATLTLSTDIAGTLIVEGSAATFTTARVGQNGRYAFIGLAGQSVGVDIANVTIPTTQVSILEPSGTQLATKSIPTAGGAVPVTTLPVTGVYTVFLSPAGAGTGTATLQLGGPDLSATAMTVPIAAITPNANGSYTFPVSYTVANGGSTSAPPSWVDRVYLSSDAVWDAADPLLNATSHTAALAAGGAYSNSPTVTTTTTTAVGSYYLIVITDQSASLAETNETNNTRVSATPVTFLNKPDLSVTALTVPSAAVSPNANGSYTFPVSYTVANGGSTSAPPSWVDRVYLSSDAVWDAADPLLNATSHTAALAAGGAYSNSPTVTTTTTTAVGSYYLIVITDQSASLAETNETNNTRVSATPVTFLNKPDLSVTALTVPSAAVSPNANGSYTFLVSYTVANGGSTSAPPSWVDRVYLSSDAVWDAADPLLNATSHTAALAAGGAYSNSPTVTTTTTTAVGSYYLIVITDQSASLAETNETNNTRVSATQVVLNP